jgi:hypothetical protein
MFSDLADAIAAQPQSSQTRQKVLKELRFQAERLRRADRINFGLARWMKEGLLAALDGLQVIAPGDTRAPFWIGAARETVSGIEKDSGVAFQRARIQDAVRSTVDAFAAVGRIDETCP